MQGSASQPREAELRVLLDAVADGTVLARDGRVVWANAALAALAGVGAAEKLHGRALDEFLLDAGEGPPRPGLGRPIACRLERPDGEARSVVVIEVDLGPGDPAAFVVRDVTELRALEAEIVHMGRALHEAHRERVDLRERLRRGSEGREELLTVVSHELRTPVTVIAGYNRLLLSGKVGALNEQQRRFVEESQKSCQRLNSFIANLLETSRGMIGGGVVEAADTPLRPTLETVVGLLEPLLREQRLEVALDLDPACPRAWFDPPRVEQVVTNLIGNAIKFAPRGGQIEIATRSLSVAGRRMVEISVSDPGPGVPPEHREKIFEPYVQVGETRGATGLGLGLAICRSIVEAHGGSISMRERPGGGSCFAFTLPAAEPSGEAS